MTDRLGSLHGIAKAAHPLVRGALGRGCRAQCQRQPTQHGGHGGSGERLRKRGQPQQPPMLGRHRRHRPGEEDRVGRPPRQRDRRVADEVDRRQRRLAPAKVRAVVGDLLIELGHGPRRVDDADELAGLRPFPHVRVLPTRDRATPDAVGGQEGVREGDVHPSEQVRVRGRIRLGALGRRIGAGHAAVQAAHAGALPVRRSGVAERHHGQPLGRAGEPAERVLLVAGVLHDAGQRAGVQGLHQQRPDPADQSGQRSVDRPRRRSRPEVALVAAVRQLPHPLRRSGRVTRHDTAETGGDALTRGVGETADHHPTVQPGGGFRTSGAERHASTTRQ